MNAAISALPANLLEPWGRALLLGGLGFLLIQAIRGEGELSAAFEALVIGTLFLAFYPWIGDTLRSLSDQLVALLISYAPESDLKTLVWKAMKDASQAPTFGTGEKTVLNIPSLTDQVLKLGVWGVMTLIIQWFFAVAFLLLEAAQAVFWKLLFLLFPLAAGLYPLFPGMLRNQVLYAIELSLWLPLLHLIDLTTAEVARSFLTGDDRLGLHLVAVELIAVLLILSIPTITHRFMSGAFSGDLGSTGSLYQNGKRWVQKYAAWRAES